MDYLAAFLNYSFLLNKKLHKGKNLDSVFLAGFTEEHIEHLKERALEILAETKRPIVVIDFVGRTWCQAISVAAGREFKTGMEAYGHLDYLQKQTNSILVVVGLSKCKERRREGYARSLIKNLDDAHFKGIYPESDLVLIDYASFLEKHWSYIGPYLRVNTLIQNFNFYPQLHDEPLRAVK